ncbi:MAG: tRNA (guanosine(37)-N1)-methyltransferase TrmD, partial [Spirochaetia bacterium]|nr:tRNA (guanosine(37)-N1)-methyltransferase TrmD [Spirochaetia bacterium]
HNTADDVPFGGKEGMVMKIEPVHRALLSVNSEVPGVKCKNVLLSASGVKLTQKKVEEYAKLDRLVLLCGRYEGVDERVLNYIDEEVCIGDYVLSGGEFGSLVIIEAVIRLLPGVLGNSDSAVNESFTSGILDYPHYTRPRKYDGYAVPDELLSGNHKEIERYRRREALKKTLKNRPDLLEGRKLGPEDKKILNEISNERSKSK